MEEERRGEEREGPKEGGREGGKLKVRGKGVEGREGEREREEGRRVQKQQYILAVCYNAPAMSFWSKPRSYKNTTHRETHPPRQ